MGSTQKAWDPATWKWDPYKLVAAPAGESPSVSKKSADGTAEVSTSGSDEHGELATSKRSNRADGPVMCQVDGCLTDLAGLKEYHNRYKICQYHLKIPCIVREGNRQRFCQQCGRFHNISEFDGDKRSCRARLQRHNARRRKKGESEPAKVARKHTKVERSSVSLTTAPSASHGAASDGHVTAMSDASPNSSNSQRQQPVSEMSQEKLAEDWQNINTSASLALDNAFSQFLAQESSFALQNFQGGPPVDDYVPSMIHADLTLNNEVIMEDMFGQSQSDSSALSASMSMQPNAILPNTLPDPHPMMHPGQYQSGANRRQGTISPMYLMQQQALLSARQRGYYEGIRNQQRRQQLQEQQAQQLQQQQQSTQPQSTQPQHFQLPPQLQQPAPQPAQHASPWLQAEELVSVPSLSFSNSLSRSMDAAMQDGPSTTVESPNASMTASRAKQRRLLDPAVAQQPQLQGSSGMPQQSSSGFAAQHCTQQQTQHAQHGQQYAQQRAQLPADTPTSLSQTPSSSVLAEAGNILSFSHAQPKYVAEEHFVRMSAKLFNCTPAHLPHDLKQNLMGLLSCGVNSIEGYIMPGCVQLTLNALIASEKHQAMRHMGARQAFELLMQQGNNRSFWGSDTMLMQWQDEVALIRNGSVQHVISGIGSLGVLPQMHSVSPLCISNRDTSILHITGINIAKEGCQVLCRHQGSYVPVRVTIERVGAAGGQQQIQVHLPAGLFRGALQLEVAHGGFISPSQAVLVMDSDEAVAELSELHTLPVPGLDVDTMMQDMGRVLEFSNSKQAYLTGRSSAAMRTYAASDIAAIEATARRLLSFSCQVGWAAVSEMLLAVAPAAGQSADAFVADLDRLVDQGMSLLHHAVCSRSASLVEMLCTWGVNNGYVWDYAAVGPRGLTPLHLAALLGDGGKVANELTDAYPGALSGWASVKAEDGSTAADLASMTGAQDINASMEDKLAGFAAGDPSFVFNPDTGELVEDDDTSLASSTAAGGDVVTDSSTGKLVEDDETGLASNTAKIVDTFTESGQAGIQEPQPAHHPPLGLPLEAEVGTAVGTAVDEEVADSPGLKTKVSISNSEPESVEAEVGKAVEDWAEAESPGLKAKISVSNSFAEDVGQAVHEFTGLKQRGKAYNSESSFRNEEDMYLEWKGYNLKAPPHMFDSQAAVLSSVVIGIVGCLALGLRYCLDYRGMEYWHT